MPPVRSTSDRVRYYARNVGLSLFPAILFRRRLGGVLERLAEYDPAYLGWRVNYYNQLAGPVALSPQAPRIRDVSPAKSMYYYDFREVARYFPPGSRLHYLFGDVRSVPGDPTFVKSRPIAADNRNSLLLKLNKFRHFYLPADRTAFPDKRPIAVWRGTQNNPKRTELVRRYQDHPLCDIGHSHGVKQGTARKAFLRPVEQMAYRYIISIEGHDVASNLKWILASNSLCLMPEPVYETWFMEGRLEAGRHYVRLAPDFADLEQHVRHYEAHPDEALAIIRNANRFVAQFRDERREQLISLLVMAKYLAATGQLTPDRRLARIIAP